MTYKNPDALVSTDWLAKHLLAPDVRVVDATTFLPGTDRDAKAEYDERHIPGAVFFDVEEIAEEGTDLPHMLPPPEKFAARVRKLGLGNGSRIVVYDGNGGHLAACRVWWTFRVFGHEDIAVLDGGLPKWMAEDRPTENLPPAPRERHFTARLDCTLVRDFDHVHANLDGGGEQIIDVRSSARYSGTADEPRPGLRRGHIPGSINLPFTRFMDQDNHFVMRGTDEMMAAVEAAGIDLEKPMVTTCGSGLTACVVAFGLYLNDHPGVAVYDGSWIEWGGRDDTPVEAG